MLRCKQNLTTRGLNHEDVYCSRNLEVADWLQNVVAQQYLMSIAISHGCKMAAVPQVPHLHTTREHPKMEGRGQRENSLFPARLFLLIKGGLS